VGTTLTLDELVARSKPAHGSVQPGVKHRPAAGDFGVVCRHAQGRPDERDAHGDPARLDQQAIRVRSGHDALVPLHHPAAKAVGKPRLLLGIGEDLQLAGRRLQRALPDILDEVHEPGVRIAVVQHHQRGGCDQPHAQITPLGLVREACAAPDRKRSGIAHPS